MIKVNLLRNLGAGQGIALDEVSNEVKTQAILRMFLILLIPGLLYTYERFNLNDFEERLQKTRQDLETMQAEKAKYGDTAPRVEAYNKQKVRVDQELSVIRTFAKNRLREVKALDALQSLIPNRAWVRRIAIEGNLVKLEGYTMSEDGISELIRALENSVYFSRVEPKSTSQEVVSGTTFKKFELEFHVGK